MKIRPRGVEFFQVDGRTERRDEAVFFFVSKFCEKPLKMRAAAPHLTRASLWSEAYLSVGGIFILSFPLFDIVSGKNMFRI
jgi:hypothetical protein